MDLTGHHSNPAHPLRRLADLDLRIDGASGDTLAAGAEVAGPGGRRLDADAVRALVAAYRSGATVREVAERFHVHRTTVTSHLERSGVRVRDAGLRMDQVHEVVALYNQGWSARRLARQFGVSDHTIAAELRKAGVRTRARYAKGG